MKKPLFLILFVLIFHGSMLFAELPVWEPISGTLYSMVVFSHIYLDDYQFTGSDTCNIAAAFGPGGETDCRALGAWQPAYPPYWNGYWYFTIMGNLNNESITFKIYNVITDSVYPCLQSVTFVDGETLGDPYNPVVLTTQPVSTTSDDHIHPEIITYPNPFNKDVSFTFSLSHEKYASFCIYDIRGRLVKTFLLDDSATHHSFEWSGYDNDGNHVAPGIYLYTMITSQHSTSGKILYLQE